MSREAFEKHYAEITGLDADNIKEARNDSDCITTRGRNYQVAFLVWQACEAEQSKRIAELEAQLAEDDKEVGQVLANFQKGIAKLEAENEALRNALANHTAKYMIKRVELQEQNAELVEALEAISGATQLTHESWTKTKLLALIKGYAQKALESCLTKQKNV